jgi:septal ring factor EnvC (AmiA/AmiB activator)
MINQSNPLNLSVVMSNVGHYLSDMSEKNIESFYDFIKEKDDADVILNVVRLVVVLLLNVWLLNRLYKCCNNPALEEMTRHLKECEEKLEESEDRISELEEELGETKEQHEKLKSAFQKYKDRYLSCKTAAQRFIDTHAESEFVS